MKKLSIAISTSVLLSSLIAVPSHAQFGGLGNLLPGSGKASAPVNIDEFIQSAAVAETLMQNSLHLLYGAVIAKKDVASLQAEQKANSEKTNTKEDNAKVMETMKSEQAALVAAAKSGELDNSINAMDSKMKATVGKSAFNFALAVLKDKALLEQSKGIINSLATNPANISKLSSVKDVASSLGNQLSMASDLATLMPTIMKKVGINELPKNESEKPQPTSME